MAGISYLILGWGSSERPELCAHLLRFGMDTSTIASVVATAPAHHEAVQAALDEQKLSAVQVLPFDPQNLSALEVANDSHIFWIPDGAEDPRDFLENVRDWIEARGDELGRIITVIDTELQETNASSHGFHELCLHFSDFVLLGNRHNVSKKAVQHYRDHLKKSAIPSRVEFLRTGGKVNAAHELLFPEARRLSLYFDPVEDYATGAFEMEGLSLKSEDTEADPRDPQSDPFLARTPEGRRRKVIHLPQ